MINTFKNINDTTKSEENIKSEDSNDDENMIKLSNKDADVYVLENSNYIKC